MSLSKPSSIKRSNTVTPKRKTSLVAAYKDSSIAPLKTVNLYERLSSDSSVTIQSLSRRPSEPTIQTQSNNGFEFNDTPRPRFPSRSHSLRKPTSVKSSNSKSLSSRSSQSDADSFSSSLSSSSFYDQPMSLESVKIPWATLKQIAEVSENSSIQKNNIKASTLQNQKSFLTSNAFLPDTIPRTTSPESFLKISSSSPSSSITPLASSLSKSPTALSNLQWSPLHPSSLGHDEEIISANIISTKRTFKINESLHTIKVTRSQGKSYIITRKYLDFYDLQVSMVFLFPVEARFKNLPILPKAIHNAAELRRTCKIQLAMATLESDLNVYLNNLLNLPSNLHQSWPIKKFFALRDQDTIEINETNDVDGLKDYKFSTLKSPEWITLSELDFKGLPSIILPELPFSLKRSYSSDSN